MKKTVGFVKVLDVEGKKEEDRVEKFKFSLRL